MKWHYVEHEHSLPQFTSLRNQGQETKSYKLEIKELCLSAEKKLLLLAEYFTVHLLDILIITGMSYNLRGRVSWFI